MSTDVIDRSPARSSLIDPRLRDRRIEVARHQGRKRLRRIVMASAIVAIVGGAVAATRSPLLDVDRIEVRGTSSAASEQIRSASGVEVGDALASIDADAAAARIEDLSWVESASVARSWPSTLTVRVTERVPVAVIGTGDDAHLVDAAGRVIATGENSDLPVIAGPVVAVGEVLSGSRSEVAEIIGVLSTELRGEVATARATSTGVVLETIDGIEVLWGDQSQQSAKVDALRVLLGQEARDSFRTIDVSVPRATTVMSEPGGS